VKASTKSLATWVVTTHARYIRPKIEHAEGRSKRHDQPDIPFIMGNIKPGEPQDPATDEKRRRNDEHCIIHGSNPKLA